MIYDVKSLLQSAVEKGVPHTGLLLERTPGNGRKVQLNKGGKL